MVAGILWIRLLSLLSSDNTLATYIYKLQRELLWVTVGCSANCVVRPEAPPAGFLVQWGYSSRGAPRIGVRGPAPGSLMDYLA